MRGAGCTAVNVRQQRGNRPALRADGLGGAPAAAECNADTVGDSVEIPYTADYYFWK
jgi:hypothetical protein